MSQHATRQVRIDEHQTKNMATETRIGSRRRTRSSCCLLLSNVQRPIFLFGVLCLILGHPETATLLVHAAEDFEDSLLYLFGPSAGDIPTTRQESPAFPLVVPMPFLGEPVGTVFQNTNVFVTMEEPFFNNATEDLKSNVFDRSRSINTKNVDSHWIPSDQLPIMAAVYWTSAWNDSSGQFWARSSAETTDLLIAQVLVEEAGRPDFEPLAAFVATWYELRPIAEESNQQAPVNDTSDSSTDGTLSFQLVLAYNEEETWAILAYQHSAGDVAFVASPEIGFNGVDKTRGATVQSIESAEAFRSLLVETNCGVPGVYAYRIDSALGESSPAPSTVPTTQPSSAPSSVPTESPSLSLSPSASAKPSDLASEMPSVSPTQIPSVQPSASLAPSGSSKPSSSRAPSVVPTVMHSNIPSQSPTMSLFPTSSARPTNVASAAPSSAPSASPSTHPSATPTVSIAPSLSEMPSTVASQAPSLVPSGLPSSNPSGSSAPSASVSPSASAVPSFSPSANPSGVPSESPTVSAVPTSSHSPTNVASDQPSMVPTVTPSQLPSAMPSNSAAPTSTARPTDVASAQPSSFPSTAPSMVPSVSSKPTISQSPSQSRAPSTAPSDWPSSVPSDSPSASMAPSVSSSPTVSVQPSGTPSSSPSAHPSSSPSDVPSLTPSTAPSSLPTGVPSSAPSLVASSSPTVVPTVVPTTAPTTMPTTAPTTMPTTVPSTMPSISATVAPTDTLVLAAAEQERDNGRAADDDQTSAISLPSLSDGWVYYLAVSGGLGMLYLLGVMLS